MAGHVGLSISNAYQLVRNLLPFLNQGSFLCLGIPGVPVGLNHVGLFPYDPAKAGLLLRFLLIIIVASV